MEARALRLKMVKVRTQTNAVHKEQKAEFLRGGKAVDAIKNILEYAVVEKENKLEEREKYFEIQEKERKRALALDRTEKLSQYGPVDSGLNLGELSNEMFETLLLGTKTSYDKWIEAERKAEEERIESERRKKLASDRYKQIIPFIFLLTDLEKEQLSEQSLGNTTEDVFAEVLKILDVRKTEYDAQQEAIKKENERLKIEAEERLKAENERLEAVRKEREEKEAEHRAQLKAQEEKAAAEKAEANRIAAELQREKQIAEDALKAQKEAEEKRLRDEAEAAENLLKAGDQEKLVLLLSDLKTLTIKYTFSSKKFQKIATDVYGLIEKIITFGQSKM